jgi:hypothetical protein
VTLHLLGLAVWIQGAGHGPCPLAWPKGRHLPVWGYPVRSVMTAPAVARENPEGPDEQLGC